MFLKLYFVVSYLTLFNLSFIDCGEFIHEHVFNEDMEIEHVTHHHFSAESVENEDVEDKKFAVVHLEHEPGCPKIPNLKPLRNIRSMMGEWFVPFMSEDWVRVMAKSSFSPGGGEKKLKKSSTLSSSCIKIRVGFMPESTNSMQNSVSSDSESESTTRTPKHQRQQLLKINSKCPRTGAEFNLACQPNEPLNSKWYCQDSKIKSENETQWSKTKVSGESYIYIIESKLRPDTVLAIRCFPKLGTNWAIVTKAKTNQKIKRSNISSKVVKELLSHVHGMGFSMKSIIELPYEKCV